MPRLRIATVGSDTEEETRLATLLERSSDVDLYIRCVDRVDLTATIRAAAVDVVLVAGVPHWFDASVRDEFSLNSVPIVGYPIDPLDRMSLESFGASLLEEAFSIPAFLEACARARPPGEDLAPSRSKDQGRVIAVWGCKGAPGRSTVAIECAFALSTGEPSTFLIDGDPFGGDLAQMLAVEPGVGISWASQVMLDAMGVSELESGLSRIGPNGPVLLSGISRPPLWQDVAHAGWRRLIPWARDRFTNVVVDTGATFRDEAEVGPSRADLIETVLGNADIVLCVVRSDAIGVRNFFCAYPELERVVAADKIRIVLNMCDGTAARSMATLIRKNTGVAVMSEIPANGLVRQAHEQGRSVQEAFPSSDLAVAFRDLAAKLGGDVKPRGVLARLAGR
jgi:MinD-like ATPase involved in chromosome partitioning or flagellar assembly